MRATGVICWLVGLLASQHALAGTATDGIIDEVVVGRSLDCHRIVIRLYRPFMVIGRLPLGPTRYFYVFGRALSAASSSSAERGRLFRERATLSRERPDWLRSVVYIGDVPGLQALLIEAESPRSFRLVPQRDPRKVIVESPADEAGASACLPKEENAGE